MDAEAPHSPVAAITPRASGSSSGSWFYKDWAGEHGPRSLKQLTRALQKGYFTQELLVRKEGTSRWHTLRDVLDLRAALSTQRAQTAKSAPSAASAVAAASKPGLVTAVVEEATFRLLFRERGAKWFYLDNEGKVQGPFSSAKMLRWAISPEYKQHFSTLRCRKGESGSFQLLPELAAAAAKASSSSTSNLTAQSKASQEGSEGVVEVEPVTSAGAAEVKHSEGEMGELKLRLKEMEEEMEQMRKEHEDDSFMLRMQLETLHREKAELAKEVARLKKEKEYLDEQLMFAPLRDVGLGEEDLVDNVDEFDESTQEWLQELEGKSPSS